MASILILKLLLVVRQFLIGGGSSPVPPALLGKPAVAPIGNL